MAHRHVLVSAVSIACASMSWSGPSARVGVHSFDFWQESESLSFASRTHDAVCADLNGDGWPELIRLGIALGDPYGGSLGITLGTAYGMQGPELHLQTLSSPRSVRAIDVNGDGLMDLVAAHLRPLAPPNQFMRTARLLIQTGAGAGGSIEFLRPAPTVDLAPGGEIVLLVDVDQDQIADLVSVGLAHELFYQQGLGLAPGTPAVPQFQSQAINISRLAAQTAGHPSGTFNFGLANDLVAGDFDGDGSTDLAVAAGSIGGGVHVFYFRPAGWVYQGFMFPVIGGTGTASMTSLARGDFNLDGLDDLVATSPSRDLTTFLNNGAILPPAGARVSVGMRAVTSPGVGRNSAHLVSADFDGDGLADIAFFDPIEQMVVAYNPPASPTPGVFSGLPAFLESFDLQGTGLRALDAVDVDVDGDVDLVGSFLLSQSTAVLSNERMANASKPVAVIRLRGAPATSALQDTFVPDGLEWVQGPNANLLSDVAVDRFTFHAISVAGKRLRLRMHLRASSTGVGARLGLLDKATSRVRWVHSERVGTSVQEIVIVLPEAARFVSNAQRLEVFVMSSGSGAAFRLGIDQLSAELIQ